jgi:hypothetical protein
MYPGDGCVMCYTKTSSVELKIKGGTPAPPPPKEKGKEEGRKEGRKEGKKAKVNVGSQLDVRLRRVGLVCVGWGGGGGGRN